MSKYTYTDQNGVEHTAEHTLGADPFPKLGTPKNLDECVIRICSLPMNSIAAGRGVDVLIEYLNNRFGAAMCDDDAVNERLLKLLENIKNGYQKKDGANE